MKRNLILKSLFETSLEFEKNLFNKTYGIRTLSSTRDKDIFFFFSFFFHKQNIKITFDIYFLTDRRLFKILVASLNELKSISIDVTGRYIQNDSVEIFAYVVRIN